MKRFLFVLFSFCALSVFAQDEKQWLLVERQSGTEVPVSSVAYLLAADDAAVFAVVCNNGRVVNGVSSATFEYAAPSAIDDVKGEESDAVLRGMVDGKLQLVCAEGTAISVYDAAGRLQQSAMAGKRETTIDVSSLPAGVYFLKAGAAEAVKFMKR
ncbi:MAG: T9SS type A sorting domain-containing protein [Prevotella sp.]